MSAIRLTLVNKTGKIRVSNSRRVTARVPPGIDPARLDDGVGSWIDVTDPAGAIVYARPIDHDFAEGLQRVRTGRAETPFRAAAHPEPTLSIMIPAVAGSVIAVRHRETAGKKPKTLLSVKADELD